MLYDKNCRIKRGEKKSNAGLTIRSVLKVLEKRFIHESLKYTRFL